MVMGFTHYRLLTSLNITVVKSYNGLNLLIFDNMVIERFDNFMVVVQFLFS